MRSVVKEGQGGPHRVPQNRSKGGVPSGMQPLRPVLPSISSSTRLREHTGISKAHYVTRFKRACDESCSHAAGGSVRFCGTGSHQWTDRRQLHAPFYFCGKVYR